MNGLKEVGEQIGTVQEDNVQRTLHHLSDALFDLVVQVGRFSPAFHVTNQCSLSYPS